MRRVITSLRTSASLDNVVRQIGYLRSASLLALTALALNTANAAEPATRDAKGKPPAVHVEEQSATAAIPECIEKLQLSAKQHDQIKGIVGKYDASIAIVWKQFGERYMQTIAMESSLLAAIEDNLSDAQRTQVQEQRRKTAHSEHATTATNGKKEQANDQVSKTVEVELASVGITMTAEQEAAADKVHGQYRTQLRSLSRDIQGLHTKLLSLEADKLVAIEKVLTKEQMTQLRAHRQTAPDARRVAVSSIESKKSE